MDGKQKETGKESLEVGSLLDALCPDKAAPPLRSKDLEEEHRFNSSLLSLKAALGNETVSTKQRLQELQSKEEEKTFDSATSSLLQALSSVSTHRSLLEDKSTSTSQQSRRKLGKGLAVIDQFALKLHERQVESGAFERSATANNKGVGKKKGNEMSKKQRKRKEKKMEKGAAYTERTKARTGAVRTGPARRGRGKGGRLQMF